MAAAPALAALCLCLGCGASWYAYRALSQHELSVASRMTAMETHRVAQVLQGKLDDCVWAAGQVAARAEAAGKIERRRFEEEAREVLKHHPDFVSLNWTDNDGTIRWIMPLAGNEVVIDWNLIAVGQNEHPRARFRALAFRRAVQTHQIVTTHTIPLRQGGSGFAVYVPLEHNETPMGVIAGVFRLSQLVQATLGEGLGEDFGVRIYDGDETTLDMPPRSGAQAAAAVRPATIELPGLSLRLELTPSVAFVAAHRSGLPQAVAVAGLCALGVTLSAAGLGANAARRARRLRTRGTEHRAMLAQRAHAIVFTDRDGRITAFNAGAEALWGYRREEVVGIFPLTALDAPGEHTLQEHLLNARRGIAVETPHRSARKDGTPIALSLSITAIVDAEDRLEGFLCMALDMSNHLRTEAELRAAKEAAEGATKARSAFLAFMSHELRTPLSGLLGTLELLLDTPLSPQQRGLTDIMRGTGQHLLSLISDILDLSKIEAGRMEVQVRDMRLPDVIEAQVDAFSAQARVKGLKLYLFVAPELAAPVRGDPLRVGQVLANLLSNAIKFTERGHVMVRAELQDESDAVWTVRLSVSDTGIGISEAARARLFSPFTQADSSIAGRYGGTGLGLSICRQLVELMGGVMGVDSTVGSGAMFYFTLQAQRPQSAVRAASPLTDKRIMVADGDVLSRDILTVYLHALGCEVLTAESAQAVLNACKSSHATAGAPPLDAIVAADSLPDMRLTQLCDVLHQLQTTPALCVVAERSALPDDAPVAARLSLPVKAQALQRALEAICAPPVVAASSSGAKSILLAEDNPVNQLVVTAHLHHLGYRVHTVRNGLEALSALNTEHFDALLMDCHMPGMDGLEATRRIRQQNREIPIIALTAAADTGDIEACHRAGMNDALPKPIAREMLAKTLARWTSGGGD